MLGCCCWLKTKTMFKIPKNTWFHGACLQFMLKFLKKILGRHAELSPKLLSWFEETSYRPKCEQNNMLQTDKHLQFIQCIISASLYYHCYSNYLLVLSLCVIVCDFYEFTSRNSSIHFWSLSNFRQLQRKVTVSCSKNFNSINVSSSKWINSTSFYFNFKSPIRNLSKN